MGVDTEIYRCRIGAFDVCMKPEVPKSSKWVSYAPQIKGNDIQGILDACLNWSQLILAELIVYMAKRYPWMLFIKYCDPYRGLAQVNRVDGFAITPYLLSSDNYYCYMDLAQHFLNRKKSGPISDKA